MSDNAMMPESDDFAQLQRLLALKRHEVPPPGYFENFSRQVIARIEAQSAAQARSWWTRWLAELDLRPAVACAYSLAVGGVLLVGLSLTPQEPAAPAAHLGAPTLGLPLLAADPAPMPAAMPAPGLTLQPMPLPGDDPSSVGAVLNPDAAPAGFFRPDGFLGGPNGTQVVPVGLNLR
jgi:hypothetical protein